MERRDRTRIQLQILCEVHMGGKLPLYTRDGLLFKMQLKTTTLQGAIEELERLNLIRVTKKQRQDGSEVAAIELTQEGREKLNEPLPLLYALSSM